MCRHIGACGVRTGYVCSSCLCQEMIDFACLFIRSNAAYSEHRDEERENDVEKYVTPIFLDICSEAFSSRIHLDTLSRNHRHVESK